MNTKNTATVVRMNESDKFNQMMFDRIVTHRGFVVRNLGVMEGLKDELVIEVKDMQLEWFKSVVIVFVDESGSYMTFIQDVISLTDGVVGLTCRDFIQYVRGDEGPNIYERGVFLCANDQHYMQISVSEVCPKHIRPILIPS